MKHVPWVKMRCDLADDPAVRRISVTEKMSRDEAVGGLHRVWSWFTQYTTEGRIDAIDLTDLAETIGVKVSFLEAMADADWLESGEDQDGRFLVALPAWDTHLSPQTKKRALARERQRMKRIRTEREFTWPDELKDSEAFMQAWGEWQAYRNEMNRPMTTQAVLRQINRIKAHGGVQWALEAIEYSIAQGYIGLYHPTEKGEQAKQAAEPDYNMPVEDTIERIHEEDRAVLEERAHVRKVLGALSPTMQRIYVTEAVARLRATGQLRDIPPGSWLDNAILRATVWAIYKERQVEGSGPRDVLGNRPSSRPPIRQT